MIKSTLWLLCGVVLLLSPFVGAVDLQLNEILQSNSLSATIFYELRLPRVLFAFCAGVILSLSGLLFQTLFRNALMTPYTLGVSSGAVLGAGVAIKLGIASFVFGISATALFGFFGALSSVFLLIYLAKFLKNSQQESLLLLGIALSLFYNAALMILFYLGNSIQNDILIRFTMGSLSIIGWENPILLTLVASGLFMALYLYRFELELLSISHESALLKGVNTKKVTLILLVISSMSIGLLVSISGPIGFVGLVVPHIISKLYPLSIGRRLGKTALFGGFFLLFCDTITRVLQTQSELPIGIITALVGGPFFLYLIITRTSK